MPLWVWVAPGMLEKSQRLCLHPAFEGRALLLCRAHWGRRAASRRLQHQLNPAVSKLSPSCPVTLAQGTARGWPLSPLQGPCNGLSPPGEPGRGTEGGDRETRSLPPGCACTGGAEAGAGGSEQMVLTAPAPSLPGDATRSGHSSAVPTHLSSPNGLGRDTKRGTHSACCSVLPVGELCCGAGGRRDLRTRRSHPGGVG